MKVSARAKTIPVFLIIFLLFCPHTHAIEHVRLDVDIDVKHSRIRGTSNIKVSAGEEVILTSGGLSIKDVRLDNVPLDAEKEGGILGLTAPEKGILSVAYEGEFREKDGRPHDGQALAGSVIREGGVSLTGIWYPVPDGLARYDTSVTLPEGYTAVSEAERTEKVRIDGKVSYRFIFPHRTDGITLVASDKYVVTGDIVGDIDIYAYFFPEEKELAKTYIQYTKKYLEMYEDLLGAYPYRRFSIVENFLPTGYSMPTFTLLGSALVKLPFIVDTSLGHEIAHQWFGNSVYIDYEAGNWAEGLTTYLADHLYREREGEGWRYRKQMLINYQSYVSADNVFPLADFRVGTDRAPRAVGYNKAAMVFHMLRKHVGNDVFFASLKDLIREHSFERALWKDIRMSFERVYGRPLEWFFDQWVMGTDMAELEVHSPEVTQSGTGYRLRFHIVQNGEPLRLKLPVTIYFEKGASSRILDLDAQTHSFELTLSNRPVRIVLDEDYDVARSLGRDEFPPVTARLFGPDKMIIALPDKSGDRYQSIVDYFKKKGAAVTPADAITRSELESRSIIVPGRKNSVLRRLSLSIPSEEAGFYMVVKENPLNPEKVVAVFEASSAAEADAALRKLSHYGKYSRLLFDEGVNTGKSIEESDRGMVVEFGD